MSNNIEFKQLVDTFDKLKPSEAKFNTQNFIGREWLFKEFDKWLESEDDGKIFLISGDPGIGKTAIMAKILQQYCTKVAAYHFCDSICDDTLNPRKFIYSIVAQLAKKFSWYREALEVAWQKVEFDDSIVTLLRLLIITPLNEKKLTESALIIVDALDEASTIGDSHTIPQILKVLNDELINSPLRLVISTRKTELLIANIFAAFQAHEIEVNRTDNLLDIREFLRKKFSEHDKLKKLLSEKKINSENVIRVICEKAEGNFLYAENLIHAILLEKQIDPLLLNKFPPGLNDFYLTFFQRTFSAQDDYQNKIRSILDIICAAGEPLTAKQMAGFLNITTPQTEQCLNKLEVYFPKRNGVYQPYHKSIMDWLMATKGNGNFRVDVENGHKLIGDELFSLYNDGNRDKFTLGYLPSHLAGYGKWEKLIILLSSLEFIEAKCTAGMTYGLIDDYNKSQTILPQEKWGMLADFSYFVRRQSHVLTRYPKLTFQQAINEFDDSRVAQAAVEWSKHQSSQPWLKLVNKWQIIPTCRMTLTGHIDSVTSCAYSSDGKKIVSASKDNTIKIWDVTTGRNLGTIQDVAHVNSCTFSPDGSKIVSASADCKIKIWDVTSLNNQPLILKGHISPVNFCVFSRDGSKIASASADKTIKVWNITSQNYSEPLFTLEGHTSFVNSCAFSHDDDRIVSASADGTIKVWNITSQDYNKLLFTLEGHTSYVNCCAFSPDSSKIVSASADKTIRIWDVITRKEKQTLDKHQDCVTSCAYSSDGKKIVSASEDRTMKIWDAITGEEQQTLYHTGEVNCCTYSPDASKIVSATRDNKVKIWDAHTQQKRDTFSGHTKSITCCVYSLDGNKIASASDDKTIKIWNATTGQYEKTLLGHKETVHCCAYSSDGKKIVSASADTTIKIWNVNANAEEKTIETGNKYRVTFCAYSPGDRKIVSASGHEITIWDITSKEKKVCDLMGHEGEVNSCVYSPKGDKIVSASDDMNIKVWNPNTGLKAKTLIGHEKLVTYCAYSPKGNTIASASHDKTIKIWDTATWQEQKALSGHTHEITSCIYSPDGCNIASVSFDNTIRIWNISTGQEIIINFVDDVLFTIAWSRDGRFLTGGGKLGKLYIWELMNMETAKKQKPISTNRNKIGILNPLRILHISDLHIDTTVDPKVLLYPLVTDLRDNEGGLGFTTLDYVIISGDLVNKASEEEYKKATQFIVDLRKTLETDFKLPFDHCLVVPGNHDVDWQTSVYDYKTEHQTVGKLTEGKYERVKGGYLVRNDKKYPSRFKNFSTFLYEPLFGQDYPLAFEEQGIATSVDVNGIQFMLFNSSWEIDHLYEKRAGIHKSALTHCLNHANHSLTTVKENKTVLRIAVWHHAISGNDKIKEDKFIEQLRKAGIKLVLHGDVHEERADVLGYWHPRSMFAIGAGTFGASAKARPESTPRSYNLIELIPNTEGKYTKVKVHTRQMRGEGGAWETMAVWPHPDKRGGKQGFYEIDL